ncbi:outer membrane protein transport protein [Motilimonas eburnea]|uniref:outer membrane protein transport protein n=1 Tax=Motilimonas eburnea TaxID=1737488 RepID=UPI001E3ADA08|nr:outer membrane protein transport protein [Motilimonas eburnea]MCE2570522.1 outer membrane protein transport protein [Motilimonas eburnea]
MVVTKSLAKRLGVLSLACIAGPSWAAGFQLNSQSATGLGRAFAGDAVIGDNASVMARNAAAMTLFDSAAMSLGFIVLDTDIKVKNSQYTSVFAPGQSFSADFSDAGDTSVAPNLHVIVPINDQWVWGANLYSNFGTKTEFDANYVAPEFGGKTDVKSFNLGASLAYRINEQWSLGAGLDLVYGKGKMRRALNTPAGQQPLLDIDADGFALGFNLGAMFELNANNRFGLSYRYSPKLEAKGDILYAPNQANPLIKNDKLYMPLPDMIEFSGYHRVSAQWALHYSVQWIGWDAFDVLKSDGHGVINRYEWQDGFHYAIGATYELNSSWTLRAGYMHDTSAQDKITSISVPDSDRNWFSAGFSYHLNANSAIDVGATYLMGEDVKVTEQSPYSQLEGKTRADAVLVGVQYSRAF